jgi:hypothetical protein
LPNNRQALVDTSAQAKEWKTVRVGMDVRRIWNGIERALSKHLALARGGAFTTTAAMPATEGTIDA